MIMSKKIEQYKELLQVLPRTNVKNSREYKKKALVMKQEMQFLTFYHIFYHQNQ